MKTIKANLVHTFKTKNGGEGWYILDNEHIEISMDDENV